MTTRPQLTGTFGMVASTHWLASAAGMAELEQGGNAFDAAVAAGFALHVVEPHLNGPGGDLPLIFARADDPAPTVLCGQGPAPAAATIAHYRGLGFELVPGAGPLATAVPGAVDAWLTLLRDHGTRRLADVLQYAISYAERGHVLQPGALQTIAAGPGSSSPRTGPRRPRCTCPEASHRRRASCSATRCWRRPTVGWSRRRRPRRAGARPASTPRWRPGKRGSSRPRSTRSPAGRSGHPGQGRHPGVITGADLAAFTATYERTSAHPFRDVVVHKTQAWGQGPVLLQQLALLDGFDDAAIDPSTVAGIHTAVEAVKLAFADREAWYGDALPPPLGGLLAPAYTAARRQLIGDTASLELRPGSPDGRSPRLPAYSVLATAAADRRPGWASPPSTAAACNRGDTCHLDVVDRWGTMVSATPSGGWLQSSPVIPALGFPLGSRLQMCWLEEGLPASLVPGRRPRTTLSPTLVYRDGRPVLACGTPGGDQQDQWQLGHAAVAPGARARRCRRRSRRRTGTATRYRARSTRARPAPVSWSSRGGSARRWPTGYAGAGTAWCSPTAGRSAGSRR